MAISRKEQRKLRKAAIKKARNNMLAFTKYTFGPDYEVNWHHRLICQELEKLLSGENDRLILNCPPRAGKTEICSRRFPAYLLGHRPDAKIIACSYGQDLANDNSVDVKSIMRSEKYKNLFPKTKLPTKEYTRAKEDRHYRNRKEIWETLDDRGRYLARGVGGGITGKGGEFLLLDDPIKDAEQARSPSQRQNVWDWFNKVFRTRANRNARILLIQTRWHQDDLVGRIKREMRESEHAKDWKIVNFPAIYRENVRDLHPEDPRDPGEALWSWFRPREEWLAMEETDPAGFSALGQGMPTPPGGTIIKEEWTNEHRWVSLPQGDREWLISIDPKGGSKDSQSSEAVIQLWCRSAQEPAEIYLIDQKSGIWSQSETKEKLEELYTKSPWSGANTILIEDKGDGPAIRRQLSGTIPGITGCNPGRKDKEQRLRDCEFFWRSGNILIPDTSMNTPGPRAENFQWLEKFIHQVTKFGTADKDDMVDAATQAILWWFDMIDDDEDDNESPQENYLVRHYSD